MMHLPAGWGNPNQLEEGSPGMGEGNPVQGVGNLVQGVDNRVKAAGSPRKGAGNPVPGEGSPFLGEGSHQPEGDNPKLGSLVKAVGSSWRRLRCSLSSQST